MSNTSPAPTTNTDAIRLPSSRGATIERIESIRPSWPRADQTLKAPCNPARHGDAQCILNIVDHGWKTLPEGLFQGRIDSCRRAGPKPIQRLQECEDEATVRFTECAPLFSAGGGTCPIAQAQRHLLDRSASFGNGPSRQVRQWRPPWVAAAATSRWPDPLPLAPPRSSRATDRPSKSTPSSAMSHAPPPVFPTMRQASMRNSGGHLGKLLDQPLRDQYPARFRNGRRDANLDGTGESLQSAPVGS